MARRGSGLLLAVVATVCACLLAAEWAVSHLRLPLPMREHDVARSTSVAALRMERRLEDLDSLQLPAEDAPFVLDEVMVRNPQVILDEDRDSHGWIEVRNRSTEARSLFGWGVSDGSRARNRWIFPDVIVDPGDTALVWASGKDRVGSSIGRSFEAHLDPRSTSGWTFGPRPKEDLRPAPAALGGLEVQVSVPRDGDYFLWLRASCEHRSWSVLEVSLPGGRSTRVAVRGGQRCRQLLVRDPRSQDGSWSLEAGECTLSIDGASGPADLHGISWVAADPSRGPGAHLHANFRLRPGEPVLLFDRRGSVVDHCRPAADGDAARSDQQLQAGRWTTGPPCPRGRSFLPAPDLSAFPSLSPEPFSLSVPARAGVDRWHYSLDGSLPGPGHPALDRPLRIAAPTALRVQGFRCGEPVTGVVTRQFWVGARPWPNLTLFCVDPHALRDPRCGIHSNSAERGRDWERTGHALIVVADRVVFDGLLGLRSHAGNGRDRGRASSLRLIARDALGEARFRHDPFQPAPGVAPRRLIVDTTSQGWRDRMSYRLVHAAGEAAPRSELVVVHLNGQHYNAGVLFEYVDETFLRSRWGHLDFDLVKGKQFQAEVGSLDHFLALGERLGSSRDWTAADVPSLDLDSLCMVHIVSMFVECSRSGEYHDDAIQGFFAIDHRQRPAGIRFLPWDIDHSFTNSDYDTFARQIEALADRPWPTRFMAPKAVHHLLDVDPSFRDRYLRHVERCLNHVFADERWIEECRELADFLSRFTLPAEWEPGEPGLKVNARWRRTMVGRAEALFRERPEHLRRHLAQALGLPEPHAVRLRIEGEGRLTIDGFLHEQDHEGFYFDGGELSLAIPPEDRARFSHFEIDGREIREPATTRAVDRDLEVAVVFDGQR